MEFIKKISSFILPAMIFIIVGAALKKKVDIYSGFSLGVKEAMDTIINIFPAVTALMVGIGMLRASGLLDFICDFLSPLLNFFKIPKEVFPLAILRPLSGSGGIAMLTDIIKNYGPDSLAGITASVICGSTETTFYTIAVYFGAVGITNTRHTVKAALIADFVGIITGILISRFLLC